MAADTIKINQSVQTVGSSLKKPAGNGKGEDELFEEFFLSLLQKISNASDSEDDCNTSSKKEINELLQGMAYPALQPSGIDDFIFPKEAPVEKGPGNIPVFTESILPLIDSEGSLTIDNLSEYALKALEDLQEKSSDAGIQSLSDGMHYDPKANDAEAIKSLLKKYAVLENNTENLDTEGRDFSQTEKKALTFGKTNDIDTVSPLQDKKSPGSETSYGGNEQNQLNDTLPAMRSQALTDEKSSAMFKAPEINSGAANLNGQTLFPTEAPKELPKTLELSQENIDKLTKSFKTLRLPDSTELSVKLTPEELGEVTVRVVLEKGHVTGHITAESRDVALMLENKLDLLKQEMVHKNVNLSDISVSVFTGQGDGSSRHSSREFLNKHGRRTPNSQGYIDETAIINDDEHDTGLNIIA